MTDAATDDGSASGAGDADASSGSRSVLRRSFGRTVRASDSLVLRSYAVVAALVGLLMVAIVLLALPHWIAETMGHTPLNMAGRALLPLIVFALLFPLVAPVVYAARNHRAGDATSRGDSLLGVVGYLFVLSIYLSLVISAPADARGEPSGLLAPVVDAFYAMPPIYGLLPPVVGVVLIVVTTRIAR